MQLLSLLRVSPHFTRSLIIFTLALYSVTAIEYMPPSESTTFFCDCQKHCQGERREVSRSTFYGHKKYRISSSQFTPQFQQFLFASSSSGSSSNLTQNAHINDFGGDVVLDNSSGSPIKKRLRHELGVVSALHDDVP